MKVDIDNVINMFKIIGEEYSYKKICEFTEEEQRKYEKLLENFKMTNSSNTSTQEKGKALEDIATFVLNSGHIFEVYNNIRTSTNELDQLIRVNTKGKVLCHNGIIDKRLKNFIGECKNYKNKVPVTYVGKICSLLNTTQNKICILFSYHGVTGKKWNDSSGLIRKFYLSSGNSDDNCCIIDFNISDFESIRSGNNFLQIIEDKILTLRNDTEYTNFLVSHESSEQVLKLQKI